MCFLVMSPFICDFLKTILSYMYAYGILLYSIFMQCLGLDGRTSIFVNL